MWIKFLYRDKHTATSVISIGSWSSLKGGRDSIGWYDCMGSKNALLIKLAMCTDGWSPETSSMWNCASKSSEPVAGTIPEIRLISFHHSFGLVSFSCRIFEKKNLLQRVFSRGLLNYDNNGKVGCHL